MGRAKGAAAVLHTAPAFSFGHGSHLGKLVDNEGPGPGAYQPKVDYCSHHQSLKGGGLGTSGRLATYGNQNPAPGEYNVSLNVTHKRAVASSIRGRDSHPCHQPHQPGPGQYPEVPAAVLHPSPPAVSISHRLQGSKEAERRPAPGEYDPCLRATSPTPLPVTMKHKRGVSAADRPESGHAVPGPGEYRPQDVTVNSRRPPSHTIAVRQRSTSCDARLPGPADYSPYIQAGAKSKGIGFSKAERYPVSLYEVRPAPGSYFTQSIAKHQAGHSMDSLHRSPPSPTIGIRHFAPNSNSGNPGPGDYGIPKDGLLRASSPAFTFRGVNAKEHVAKTPAPGQYNPDRYVEFESAHCSAPAVSISHRQEQPRSQGRQPGPGEYDPCLRATSPTPLPVTMKHKRGVSAADRPESGHAVPGPGEYKLPSTLGGPAHTIGTKLKDSKTEDKVPGPGEYNVHESTIGVGGLS